MAKLRNNVNVGVTPLHQHTSDAPSDKSSSTALSAASSISNINVSTHTIVNDVSFFTYNKGVRHISDDSACTSCLAKFSVVGDEKSVGCFICKGFYHIRCVNISKSLFSTLEKAIDAIEWLCPHCRGGELEATSG